MQTLTPRRRIGFSLIELVIVVVIIGIIGAIAIPRLSRGAAGANDSALAGDLAVLRNAIDLYAAEHDGNFPTMSNFFGQLVGYTDASGANSPTPTPTHVYGPYIRRVPPLPVGAEAGSIAFGAFGDPNVGWVYNETTGRIFANCSASEIDASGKLYSDY